MSYETMTLTANRCTVTLVFKDKALHWLYRVDMGGSMYSMVSKGKAIKPVISNRVTETLSVRTFSSSDVVRLLENWVKCSKEAYGRIRYTSDSGTKEIVSPTPLKLYDLKVYQDLLDTTEVRSISYEEYVALVNATEQTVGNQIRARERVRSKQAGRVSYV